MTVNTYKKLDVVTRIVAYAIITVSIITANWILTLIAFVAVVSIFILLRLKVKGIVEDERTNVVTQKATRFTNGLSTFCLAIAGMVLVFLNHDNLSGTQAQIGYTLFFSSFAMTIINDIAYYFYSRKLSGKEQI